MQIGPFRLANQLALAPMAGVTDLPFRRLCRRMGAGLVVSEMVTADQRLWQSRKSSQRMDHTGEPGPIAVQIAGGDPQMLASAARANVDLGAQIIDINMGCPAKKVCKKAAGSALLQDEPLVRQILEAVVAAVDVPVTLKIRTGWAPDHRNAVVIARMAEDIGVQALSIHGRTRACRFNGQAEYDTIAEVVHHLRIPVIANGDINSPQKAEEVLEYTGASGIMIGRAAQGNPWIFRDIGEYLRNGIVPAPPGITEVRNEVLAHLRDLHEFYGDFTGVRIARKHLGWYMQSLPDGKGFCQQFNGLEETREQLAAVEDYFQYLSGSTDGLGPGRYGQVPLVETKINAEQDGVLAA